MCDAVKTGVAVPSTPSMPGAGSNPVDADTLKEIGSICAEQLKNLPDSYRDAKWRIVWGMWWNDPKPYSEVPGFELRYNVSPDIDITKAAIKLACSDALKTACSAAVHLAIDPKVNPKIDSTPAPAREPARKAANSAIDNAIGQAVDNAIKRLQDEIDKHPELFKSKQPKDGEPGPDGKVYTKTPSSGATTTSA